MKERLLADLDARIARHADGDSSGVLDERALALVSELTGLGEPDAGSLVRVAALHLCRYQALPPELGEPDLRMAQLLYTKLHTVDPRLAPPRVRDFFGLASPHDGGVARLREYERTGDLEHLERAISLFRQEVLDGRTGGALHSLGMALLRRFERTGQPADLDEAVKVSEEVADDERLAAELRDRIAEYVAARRADAAQRRSVAEGDSPKRAR
jgi:hypothetical protein